MGIALTRSKDRLLNLLNLKGEEKETDNLSVREASISDMTVDDLKDVTKGCSAVVSCLGHHLNFYGMFREGYFVKEAVEKVTTAMPSDSCRYILMGSDGIAHPDGVTDPKRPFFDRAVFKLMRFLLVPVRDNEFSAKYLYESVKNKDWSIVRPGDLFDKDDGAEIYGPSNAKDDDDDYEIRARPAESLFGGGSIARSDVARFMTKLATMPSKDFQAAYNHKMPVIYQRAVAEEEGKKV